MTDTKKIASLNIGRTSQLVLDNIGPVLDETRIATLGEMKNDYRAGKLDEIKMFSKVASLCTLDDIEQRLRNRILKGNQIAKEIANEWQDITRRSSTSSH